MREDLRELYQSVILDHARAAQLRLSGPDDL